MKKKERRRTTSESTPRTKPLSPFFFAPRFLLSAWKEVLLKSQGRKQNCNTQDVGHYKCNSQLLTSQDNPDSYWKTITSVRYYRSHETLTEESLLFPDSIVVHICLNDKDRTFVFELQLSLFAVLVMKTVNMTNYWKVRLTKKTWSPYLTRWTSLEGVPGELTRESWTLPFTCLTMAAMKT